MKSLIFLKDKFSSRRLLAFWILFHLLVSVFFLRVFLTSGKTVKIDADLFNMLPKQFSTEAAGKVEKKLVDSTNRNVFILSCNRDFEAAKDNAEKVYEELKDSNNFNSLMLYQDSEILGDFEDFVFENRFNFMNCLPEVSKMSECALEKLYSPFTYTSLEHLDRDPFLLTEMEVGNYIETLVSNGTAFNPKENVLAREWNGSWYVMLRGILSAEGAALATSKNGISEIYSVCSKHEKNGQRFVCSGMAFHSHKSSSAASKEVTVISCVSFFAVLVLLLFVFRTPVPVLLSLASIGVSVSTAFLFTVCVFNGIHVLALVFGTTLIGACIDYSLHFFINWKANISVNTGQEIRKSLFSGIFLSFASTEICFALLLFAPFELLRQMAVFSMSGIFSTFLTAMCIYPLVRLPENNSRKVFGMKFLQVLEGNKRKSFGRMAISLMFAFCFICLGFRYEKCIVKNDLSRLYKMEGRVMEDQIESSRVLNYAPRGWFVLRGSSADELLVLEKNFAADFRKRADGVTMFCTSDFLPSIKEQIKSKEEYEKLMPMMKDQLVLIGEDESKTAEIISEWKDKKDSFTSYEDFPQFLKELCSNFWIGQVDGFWYSVIMPSSIPNEIDGKEIAEAYGNDVVYINKVSDISLDLDILTVMILKFFVLACFVIFLLLKVFYSLKQSLKIISVPLLIVLMVGSVYSLAGIHLEFFSITGIILVFGLSLDYLIYMTEVQKRKDCQENKRLESFAVFLSFATTAISFGAIALSSFVPVHLMGLAILVGLVTAYSASLFYGSYE